MIQISTCGNCRFRQKIGKVDASDVAINTYCVNRKRRQICVHRSGQSDISVTSSPCQILSQGLEKSELNLYRDILEVIHSLCNAQKMRLEHVTFAI